jgi:hypothetical protein
VSTAGRDSVGRWDVILASGWDGLAEVARVGAGSTVPGVLGRRDEGVWVSRGLFVEGA